MYSSIKNAKCFGWLSFCLWFLFQFSSGAAETLLSPEQTLYDVTFGAGTFVAVGTNGTIFTSVNGGPWEQRISGSTQRLEAVAYGGGTFVAAGENGAILSSSDGIQWSTHTVSAVLTSPDLAYGNGRFALGGKGRAGFWTVLVSSNGLDWVSTEIEAQGPSPEGLPFKGITFGAGKFLAVGGTHGANLLVTSTNALTWKEQGITGAVGGNNGAVKRPLAYGNGQFVMAAEWLPPDDDDDDGDFVAFSQFQQDRLFFSDDGVSWRETSRYNSEMTAVAAAGCTFVLIGGNNTVSASHEGLEWFPVPNSRVLNSVAFGNGGFVGVGNAIAPLNIPPPTNRSFYVYPSRMTAVAGGYFSLQTSLSCLQPPVHLQWQFNGVALLGATNNYLELGSLTTNQAGTYTVVASNSLGESATSDAAIVTIADEPEKAPVIVYPTEKTEMSAMRGRDQYLYANVVDTGPLASYQWRLNGVDLNGATNSYLYLYNVSDDAAGEYTVRVANSRGNAVSAPINVSVVSSPPSPLEFTQTQFSFIEGPNELFSNLHAQGSPPPSLYILKNGTNLTLPLTESYALRIPDLSQADMGDYSVVASNAFGVVTSKVARVSVTPAGPLDRWTLRNPHRHLNSVSFGSGRFVAVGEHGSILTSPGGKNWTQRNLRAEAELYGVTFGNGLFAAVAGPNILTSPDGVTWTTQLTRNELFLAGGIAFGAGRFVAVGGDTILTSADGITWTDVPLPSTSTRWFSAVTFGNGTFVAAAPPTLWTSENGTSWSPLPGGPVAELESVSFANGQFIAVGNNGAIFTSPNGRTWTSQDSDVSNRLLDVTYGNGKYIAVGTRGRVLNSSNAVSWKEEDSGTPDRLESVTFGNGVFVAVGENGTVLYSANGSEWLAETSHGPTEDLDGMTLGDGQIVIVGKGGTVMTSTNGIDFSEQSSGIAEELHGVGWGNGLFAAVGEPGVVLTSPDAVQWTVRPSGSTSSLKSVARGRERWVAAGTQGEILTSNDGISWSSTFSPTANDLNGVAYGHGLFVIVGDNLPPNGTILTSPDGLNWTRRNQYVGKNLRSVTFANDVFLATANDGLLLISTNGIEWQLRSSALFNPRNLRGATYAAGLWMVVGNSGSLFSSTNGYHWLSHPIPTFENLHGIVWFGGRFVSIGNSGTVLHSANLASTAHLGGRFISSGFELSLTGEPGVTYRLEAAQDIGASIWTNLGSVTLVPGGSTFLDSSTNFNQRFYRAVSP